MRLVGGLRLGRETDASMKRFVRVIIVRVVF